MNDEQTLPVETEPLPIPVETEPTSQESMQAFREKVSEALGKYKDSLSLFSKLKQMQKQTGFAMGVPVRLKKRHSKRKGR